MGNSQLLNKMSRVIEVKPGDLVRIIAPSGKGVPQNLVRIKAYVESLGLIASISDNIYNPEEPFYSNFDQFRANDLASAILDQKCKVIWCIRGGSGANRLIKYLDELLPDSVHPKLFIGYSDITVLHLYISRKLGWATVHGAMLEAIVNGSYDRASKTVTTLVEMIFRPLSTVVTFPYLKRLDRNGHFQQIDGPVIGGNLTLVEASIGTSWEIQAKDKILLFEDISNAAYSVERSLEHLKQANVFENVKAVVFGDFTKPDNENLVNLVQERFALDNVIKCLVFVVEGIGHGKVNIPIPLNSKGGISPCVDEGEEVYSLYARL